MKFQWSIQSSHTQLARSQVTYLTSRNEHIWLPSKCLHLIEIFLFGFHFSYFFIYTTQFWRSDVMKFLWWISLWLWYHTFEYIFAPPFPSQISFQRKAFSALSLLEIDVCRVFWHKNKCEEIYKYKSTHVSKSSKIID